jgi:hypothetical protein
MRIIRPSETRTHDEEALDALQLAIMPGQIEGAAGPVGIGLLEPLRKLFVYRSYRLASMSMKSPSAQLKEYDQPLYDHLL